jgi:hypothetical protein
VVTRPDHAVAELPALVARIEARLARVRACIGRRGFREQVEGWLFCGAPEDAVVAPMDPVGDAAVAARRNLQIALMALEAVPVADLEPATPRRDRCQNPSCAVVLAVSKAGRCRACFEYRRRTGGDAPTEIVSRRGRI